MKLPRGRPLTYPEKLIRVQVTLDQESIEKAKILGHGNLSQGVREAIQKFDLPIVLAK